jgi:hypothetical protein
MSTEIRLTGLDAANPGAFLAALGLLDVLQAAGVSAQLRWTAWGGWRPEVRGVASQEALVEIIAADLRGNRNAQVYGFTYPRDSGTRAGDPIGDLKAHPRDLRDRLLAPLRRDATRMDRSAVDACAGLVAEGGVDNSGKAKPTAFHFTAGQQNCSLSMIDGSSGMGVTEEHIRRGALRPVDPPGCARRPSGGMSATAANTRYGQPTPRPIQRYASPLWSGWGFLGSASFRALRCEGKPGPQPSRGHGRMDISPGPYGRGGSGLPRSPRSSPSI